MFRDLTSLFGRSSRPSHRQRGPRWYTRPALLVGLLGALVAGLLVALAAYLMVPRTEAAADRPQRDDGTPASTTAGTQDPAPASRTSRPRKSASPSPSEAATTAAAAETKRPKAPTTTAPAPTASTTTSSPGVLPTLFPGRGNANGHGKPNR